MKNRITAVLAWTALVLALTASIVLLFFPFYQGVEETAPGGQGTPQTFTRTLIQMNGYNVLIPLAIPPVLTAAGLFAVMRARRGRQFLVWTPSFLMAAFVFFTGFSIGTLYLPAMILSMTCTILTQIEARRNAVG